MYIAIIFFNSGVLDIGVIIVYIKMEHNSSISEHNLPSYLPLIPRDLTLDNIADDYYYPIYAVLNNLYVFIYRHLFN